ncbi:glycosyltransferase family 1 protein [Archangium minus]|uniref:Glycosyltransferase family 1 protein n=1 Tax=Archangium minus TaxID=83450 RepID=A0ABY9WMW6_9BACT|nr:glycosyltransferase family 1 protein [Archangium minus]
MSYLPDLVCLSHLRWKFVFQRPQHLMSRFARERRVFFVEEPAWGPGPTRMEVSRSPEGVWIAVPHIEVEGASQVTPAPPPGIRMDPDLLEAIQRELLEELLEDQGVNNFVLWYYTPMALAFSRRLRPRAVVYDCMDELSAFTGAPPVLVQREAELMRHVDVMFTGGHHLYEAKRERHSNVHPFPSSVDVPHFAQARRGPDAPHDQAHLPRPRIGFCGVIDERMDLVLVEGVARARPDWQLVMVGPVVKISPDSLPRLPNIHYLGGKSYQELPAYLASWDVAMTPFARTPATRFLSPTKTPEYLAAGRPVVSTSIRDVVRPYGELGLVRIADTPEAFVRAVEESLSQSHEEWLPRVDAFLSRLSWEHTWRGMKDHVDRAVEARSRQHPVSTPEPQMET